MEFFLIPGTWSRAGAHQLADSHSPDQPHALQAHSLGGDGVPAQVAETQSPPADHRADDPAAAAHPAGAAGRLPGGPLCRRRWAAPARGPNTWSSSTTRRAWPTAGARRGTSTPRSRSPGIRSSRWPGKPPWPIPPRKCRSFSCPTSSGSFKVTDESLAVLGSKTVPADVLAKLKPLVNEAYDREQFLEELRAAPGGGRPQAFRAGPAARDRHRQAEVRPPARQPQRGRHRQSPG